MNFNDALNEVLAQRKYDVLAGRKPDFSKITDDFISSVIRFILEHLNIPDIPGGAGSFSMLPNFFMVLGIVAAVAILGFIINLVIKRRRRVLSMDELIEDLQENKVTAETLLSRGRALAGAGNFRDAVRYGFIALLWNMSVKQILFLDKSKTNNQLKREAKQNAPELAGMFAGVVEIFNYTWFGHKKMSPEKFDDYDTKINNLIEEANRFEKDRPS